MFDMFMFDIFPLIFGLVFLLVMAVFLVTLIRGVREWFHNNASPRLRVPATVVTHRCASHHHHHTHNGMHHTSTTHSYYVTFQVESGDRMELSLSGREYGMIAEGDYGILTFQGTRFLSFERTDNNRF